MNASTANANQSAAMSISQQSEVYRMFHDAGRSPILIALYGIKVLIAAVAIFLNFNLAWVTFAGKSLRSNCNVLIALYAICTSFQQANFLVPFLSALSGQPYIPYGLCFALQTVPIFCSFAGFPLTFFIALERFFGVFCPIWFKKRNQRLFLAGTLGICAVLGLYVVAQDLLTALQDPNQEVICAVGPKVDASFFTFLILAMNMASICFYAAIWARFKLSSSEFSAIQKQVLRCLFVILLLELFGWALVAFLRLTMAPLFRIPPSTFLGFLLINLTTNFAYIAMALTTPVLYMFSKEHREALQQHFARFLGQRFFGSNVVHSTNGGGPIISGAGEARRSQQMQQMANGGSPYITNVPMIRSSRSRSKE